MKIALTLHHVKTMQFCTNAEPVEMLSLVARRSVL
jgi:hypothetical protein